MVIKNFFKQKVSKFGSLISLLVLAAMLTLFSLFIPELITSVAGRIFVVLWAIMSIIAFVAHATSIRLEREYPKYSQLIMKKEGRTRKKARPERLMRGL
jgi:hypothetical protein